MFGMQTEGGTFPENIRLVLPLLSLIRRTYPVLLCSVILILQYRFVRLALESHLNDKPHGMDDKFS